MAKISSREHQFRGLPQVDEEDEELEENLDPRQRSVAGGGPSGRAGGASCCAGGPSWRSGRTSGRARSSRGPQRSSSRVRTSAGLWLPPALLLLLLLSLPRLNLGTYLPEAGAMAAAATGTAGAAASRGGCATGAASVTRVASDLLKSCSFRAFSFSSNSLSLSVAVFLQ